MLLGDVSKIKTGNLDVNAKVKNGRYPFFTCAQKPEKIDSYSFDCECVLVAGNGDLNIKYYEGKFDVYQRTYVVEVLKKGRLNTRFLFYFLKKYLDKLRSQSIGGVIKYIKMANLTDIELPEYSLEKQKQIVQILDIADNLCQKRKKQIALIDDYLKSVFLEMFGDPRVDSRWNLINFGEVIDILTDYHANGSYEVLRKHVELKSKHDYALMVRTTDLENNNFTDNVKHISKNAYNFLEKSKIYGGEIIITKIGSAGNVYIMPNLNRPVSLGMNAFLLRFKKNTNNIFVYYLLTSDYGKYVIKSKIKGAVTKTIRKDAVRSLKIPLPSLELQNKFASIVEQVEKTKQKMRDSLNEMDNHFNALMQKYFG